MKMKKIMRVGEMKFLEKFAWLPIRKQTILSDNNNQIVSKEVEWIWLKKYWRCDVVQTIDRSPDGIFLLWVIDDVFFDEQKAIEYAVELKKKHSIQFKVSKSFLNKVSAAELVEKEKIRKMQEMTSIGYKDDMEELE
jgi:hypothetical protein